MRKRRKRKTAILLAAAMLVSVRTGAAKPIDVYAAGEVRAGILISGSSGYTEKIPDGMFTAEVSVSNKSEAAVKVTALAAVYDSSGVLKSVYRGDEAEAAAGAEITAKVTADGGAAGDGDTVKLFALEGQSQMPYTAAVRASKSGNDIYGDTLDTAAYIPDVSKQINGEINTGGDADCFEFKAPSGGSYNILCYNSSGITAELYDSGKKLIKTSGSCSLSTGEKYYIKLSGGTGGEYTLIIQKQEGSDNKFDIYEFDVELNKYKTQIYEKCEEIYSTNPERAKEINRLAAEITEEDIKEHELPQFLQNTGKDITDYDDKINAYFAAKAGALRGVMTKYKELLKSIDAAEDEPAEYYCPDISSKAPLMRADENNNLVIIPKEEIQSGQVRPQQTDDTSSSISGAELTVSAFKDTGIMLNVTYPYAAKRKYIYVYDFNTTDGITKYDSAWYTTSISGKKEPKSNVSNGSHLIENLTPGGIYVVEALWSYDMTGTVGGENSIHRYIQLPYSTDESYITMTSEHINAVIERFDSSTAYTEDKERWLERMDMVYEAMQSFTGYTPYNGKKMTLKSSRADFNENQPDGQNYWRLTMGRSGDPIEISQPFYRGHMRRLAEDWGDTPIHEISHNFDSGRWIFDNETLAFIKLAYVLETLNGKVYRVDTQKWYSGAEYASFLKTDWFEGYNESIKKGIYMPAGLASILLDIKAQIGWEAFSKTFKYFGGLPESLVPQTEGGKLNLFLTQLKKYSGKDVFGMITGADKEVLKTNFGEEIKEYVVPAEELTGGALGRIADMSVQKGDYKQYQFSPSETGTYSIYTSRYGGTGVPNDTYIEVHSENTETGTPLKSNDDFDGSRFSRVDMTLTKGVTYYVKVFNYNQSNNRLHARLNVVKSEPEEEMILDNPVDVGVKSTQFRMYRFRAPENGRYIFKSDKTGTNDTYIKLYAGRNQTELTGQGDSRIECNLMAGHTYYLQFSGFLMKEAQGRVVVSQPNTLKFTKRSDSSFIFVNSPEYLTRFDIVDDECHTDSTEGELSLRPYLKIFEQENVSGKNTFYETHVAWLGEDAEYYEPISDFYMDIDFYNPTGNTITVSINNLAYGTEYSVLKNYYEGTGVNVNISIPAHEHRLLFECLNAPLMLSYPGEPINQNGWDWERHRSPIILFDFQVDNDSVVVSSLAAYNRRNLHLQSGSKNVLDSIGAISETGEIITDLASRLNEPDLHDKYKGIAKNQSAWIDVNLELVIDDSTILGEPLRINLRDKNYPNGVANPKMWWMTNINPLRDEWSGLTHSMPESEHHFTYHRDIGGVWNFAYNYRDLRDINTDAKGSASINNPVPESIMINAALDVAKGQKEHFTGAPDGYALGMGAWGATYHYNVFVKNDTNSEKEISYQAKTFDNMIFGYKSSTDNVYKVRYIPNIGNDESDWTSLKSITIPANQSVAFEIVTLLGGGHGGTNNRIIVN